MTSIVYCKLGWMFQDALICNDSCLDLIFDFFSSGLSHSFLKRYIYSFSQGITTRLNWHLFLFSSLAQTECVRRLPDCDLPRAICDRNDKKEFYCRCKPGYSGNGNSCTGNYRTTCSIPPFPSPGDLQWLYPQTYKQTHTTTVEQGGVLIRHSDINLHWLDIPELTLRDNKIFVGDGVRWPRLICQLGSAILGFTISLKAW